MKKNKLNRRRTEIDDATLLQGGLSSEMVQRQAKSGLSNKPGFDFHTSYTLIVLKNIFNWFNIILFTVAIIFVVLGVGFGDSHYGITKYAFLIIVIINLIIGIYQECKAKRTLEKLKLVNTPKARVIRDGKEIKINVDELVENDLLLVERGMQIPVDGVVLSGNLSMNESMLTGEQIEKKRVVGDLVYGGTIVNEGKAKIKITAVGKKTYANRLKKDLSKQAKPKSEMVTGVHVIVMMLSILIIPFACVTGYTAYQTLIQHGQALDNNAVQTIAVEIGTTIVGAIPTGLVLLTSTRCALSIISLFKKNTAIRELRAVEGLAYSKVVCLDKTGTLTTGKMNWYQTHFFINDEEYVTDKLARVLAGVPDNSETINALRRHYPYYGQETPKDVIPFNSKIKYSGCEFEDEKGYLFALGAPSYLLDDSFASVKKEVDMMARQGYRVLTFVKKNRKNGKVTPLCNLCLVDEIRPHVVEAIRNLVESNVQLKIISGDNPLTASAIAARLGIPNAEKYLDLTGYESSKVKESVNDTVVYGRATPEQKKDIVQALQEQGLRVTMVIDGLNDLLASKASDCSVAISHAGGAPAVSQVADVTILDGDFKHMPEIIKEGRKSVNDMQRSATLFLMKSFLALGLAAFSPIFGHLPYSIEGLYLVTWFVTGLGGFVLGLEDTNEEIKGKFLPNVMSNSIPSALFLLMVVISVQLMVHFNGVGYALIQPRGNAELDQFFVQKGYVLGQSISYNEFQNLYSEWMKSGHTSSIYMNMFVLEEPLAIISCVIASLAVLVRTVMPLNKFRIFSMSLVVICILGFLCLMPNYFLGVDSVPKELRMKIIFLFGQNSALYWLFTKYMISWIWLLCLILLSFPILSLMQNFSDRYIFKKTDKFGKLFECVDFKTDDSLKNSFKFLYK